MEAWFVPYSGARARGTVLLFHGHAASKDSQLREARAFHDLGFNAFLVDFYGSGGSGGNTTSIGFHESRDVARALHYVAGVDHHGQTVLYGASMGAAAVLKAVAEDHLQPAALILECPFDRLLTTVRHRFATHGVPSFPMADLLVLWGGVQEGFNGFRYQPVEYASHVDRPTLLMAGGSDPWVRPEETRAIYARLHGAKALELFPGLGHDSCLRARPEEWKRRVSLFLGSVIEDRALAPAGR